ncbi:MAG: zinc ribbon domain-containing protein, partial [Armatimonadetes bacterium]|nr:zinc ribbon domain-containing protein [Armatimonadota bacterium]
MAPPADAGASPAVAATVFCVECGQENPLHRGACLMCFAPLQQDVLELPCPNCGAENSKEARFCRACGNPFSAGATRPQTVSETAMRVLHGGVAALTAEEEGEEGYYEEEESGFLGGAAAEAVAGA